MSTATCSFFFFFPLFLNYSVKWVFTSHCLKNLIAKFHVESEFGRERRRITVIYFHFSNVSTAALVMHCSSCV